MRKGLESIFYVVLAFAWVFLFDAICVRLFGENIPMRLAFLLCGISIAILVTWTIKYLTFRLKEQRAKESSSDKEE